MPNDDPARIDELLQRVGEKRETELIAFSLQLIASKYSVCSAAGFPEEFNLIKNMTSSERRRLVSDPLYSAWRGQTADALNDEVSLQSRLSEFGRVVDATLSVNESAGDVVVDGKSVLVKRFDVDPLIMQAAFPEYRLPDRARIKSFEENVIYPPALFASMLKTALERIKTAWREAYSNFPRFVKIVVDMIDGEYTSYSSAGHTGVIFVSTDNSPLIALEEYLIHEFGHQILYHVMEIDPLVVDRDAAVYELPWSGNQRDFYGYFHAFYIYTLIVSYLSRVNNRSKREQRRIEERKTHILRGLKKAVETFERSDNFTGCGRILFDNLRREINNLEGDSVEG